MKTETTPVQMPTPYGVLYVAVSRAEEVTHHDTLRGNVTKLRPQVRVASSPEFEANPDAPEHWTLRGRAYAIHDLIYFEDRTHIRHSNGYQEGRWHTPSSHPYGGGFRNARRQQVPYRSATHDLMWTAVTNALDAFQELHPTWRTFSKYLHQRGQQVRHEKEAAQLRASAAEHDAKAQQYADRAAQFGESVNPQLFAFLPTPH